MSRGSRNADFFVNELVIGFGFLGGLFARVGLDPESVIYDALLEVVKSLLPTLTPIFSLIFLLLAILSIASSILAAYRLGGLIGLLSVGFGFVGGFIMVGGSSTEAIVGTILLVIAIPLGKVASE
jgi:hypothetical protein